MPAYIMVIREKALDGSRMAAYWSKAEFPSLEVARVWYENPAPQPAALRQFDSLLADMEYCDRF